ncbi:MAG: M14 family zinc carboxypeptidase, partial [Anaerolineae bacterium]
MRKPFGSINVRSDEGQAVLSWDTRSAHECSTVSNEFAIWRIYRQLHRDFDFGVDGSDYFLGLDGRAADLIYEGSLPVKGNHYSWRDTTAPLGITCSYFLASAHSGLVGPLPVRLHDPEIIWSYKRLLPRLQTLAERAGSLAKLTVCGQSVVGRDIYSLEVGTVDYCIAIVGLQHAGETGPELIVPVLERLMERQPELLQHTRVLIVPSLNPDRREELAEGVPWYLRTNLQGIDLN